MTLKSKRAVQFDGSVNLFFLSLIPVDALLHVMKKDWIRTTGCRQDTAPSGHVTTKRMVSLYSTVTWSIVSRELLLEFLVDIQARSSVLSSRVCEISIGIR